jgi:hypothetical protein
LHDSESNCEHRTAVPASLCPALRPPVSPEQSATPYEPSGQRCWRAAGRMFTPRARPRFARRRSYKESF